MKPVGLAERDLLLLFLFLLLGVASESLFQNITPVIEYLPELLLHHDSIE